jgi:hypothetical protein
MPSGTSNFVLLQDVRITISARTVGIPVCLAKSEDK